MPKKQRVYKKGTVAGVEYPTIGKSVELDVMKLTVELQLAGLLHGIGQKLGDAASGKSPAEKYEMACRVRDGLLAGEWELTATRDNTEAVIEAVARVKDIEVDDVREALDDADDPEAKVAEWRQHPKVKAAMKQIAAEKAQEAADASDDDEVTL